MCSEGVSWTHFVQDTVDLCILVKMVFNRRIPKKKIWYFLVHQFLKVSVPRCINIYMRKHTHLLSSVIFLYKFYLRIIKLRVHVRFSYLSVHSFFIAGSTNQTANHLLRCQPQAAVIFQVSLCPDNKGKDANWLSYFLDKPFFIFF